MEGRLIIEEKIEVADVETAKTILETISGTTNKVSEITFNDIFLLMRKGRKIEEVTEQLRSGGLLEARQLELTEKGKGWLRKKIAEFK